MRTLTSLLAIAATSVALIVLSSGCSSTASSTPEITGPRYTAYIRVESNVIRGGGIKVNGMPSGTMPARVPVEVDPSGKLRKQYIIGLAANPLLPTTTRASTENAVDIGSVTLNVGDQAPARIAFTDTEPEITGTALIEGPN